MNKYMTINERRKKLGLDPLDTDIASQVWDVHIISHVNSNSFKNKIDRDIYYDLAQEELENNIPGLKGI